MANILEAAGCDRIISMDLHASQIQGFTNLSFDNLYGIKLHIDRLKETVFKGLTQEEINSKYLLVSLDVGGAKIIRDFAKRLQMSHAIMDKQRDYSKPGTVVKSILIGDSVVGKVAICIDDMTDTCGTLVSGMTDLQEHVVIGAIIVVTHGIFSGPAFSRLNNSDMVEHVIVINTLDQTKNQERTDKLEIVDAGPLLAKVIRRIIEGGSISEFFN